VQRSFNSFFFPRYLSKDGTWSSGSRIPEETRYKYIDRRIKISGSVLTHFSVAATSLRLTPSGSKAAADLCSKYWRYYSDYICNLLRVIWTLSRVLDPSHSCFLNLYGKSTWLGGIYKPANHKCEMNHVMPFSMPLMHKQLICQCLINRKSC